jgi:uncharacterized protein (DUF427 family)
MGIRIRDLLGQYVGEWRFEPTGKRIRGILDGETLLDSRRAILVWEPRRVLPSYAVPVGDVAGELVELSQSTEAPAPAPGDGLPDVAMNGPILHPTVPFRIHSGAGIQLEARMSGSARAAEAFRPADPDLREYIVFGFDSLDTWLEEDDEAIGHPRDPYWRVDVRSSAQVVEIQLDGQTLAASNRPLLAFETMLPVRYYFHPEDVEVPLIPSPTRTICPYKGRARYWSLDLLGQVHPDLAWTYAEPFGDASALAGYVCFFDERLDLVLDGSRRPRPRTPWS